MDASHEPPEFSATVKPFDPLVLDRAVIALPLLKDMQEELNLLKEFEGPLKDPADPRNTAIELNSNFPDGGLEAALKHIQEWARQEAKECDSVFYRRLDRFREIQKDEEEINVEKKRWNDFKEAYAVQSVDPPGPDSIHSFARLHAAVVRRILSRNDRFNEDRAKRPIIRILPRRFEIIIDLNLEHPGGREAARKWVFTNVPVAKELAEISDPGQEVFEEKSRLSKQYLFARLQAEAIQRLVKLDIEHAIKLAEVDAEERKTRDPNLPFIEAARFRAIHQIWPDFPVSACINKSIATVKADAAQISFSARGKGITWAVLDSGIDRAHQHFVMHGNIDPKSSWHRDFTVEGDDPLSDKNGHGTHVAGIIAGEWVVDLKDQKAVWPVAVSRYRADANNTVEYQQTAISHICGMAPECKLVSLKVLDEDGKGSASSLIAAIAHIQEINGYGRRFLINGVNMSVGYTFEPEWFACGQSPLCVEVDRLVKSGVAVVVAAGNTGYGMLKSSLGTSAAGMALTINDPGNAELAITVGSTHRDKPHEYGVSYFSSKGPTGDGRNKPDLVAPGEKIVSCATGALKSKGALDVAKCDYVETSGTSMAAPHVSGVVAAFLSVRSEFIGKPEKVKDILLKTATDLRRDRYFQGAGLVDLMRAIQSI